jgi:hypothetical protein
MISGGRIEKADDDGEWSDAANVCLILESDYENYFEGSIESSIEIMKRSERK